MPHDIGPEHRQELDALEAGLRRRAGAPAAAPSTWEQVAAAARSGTDTPPPRQGADGSTVLDWAQSTGRITAKSRSHFDAELRRDPAGTDALIRILAPYLPAASAPSEARPVLAAAPVPARLAGTGVAASQTASGLDVSALHPRLQAAAARQPDRGLVYRWIERYAGENIDPAMLSMEGENVLAAEVRKDDNIAHAQRLHDESAAIAAASEAHQRAMADAHHERHWGPNSPAAQAARRTGSE